MRPYRLADEANLLALFADPDVMRYVGDGRPIATPESERAVDRIFAKQSADPSFLMWTIRVDNDFAGHAELKRRGGRSEYELIYVLQRARWGRGVATRVVDLLLQVARRRTIPFVIATVHPENAASIAVLRKFGFAADDRLSSELDASAFRLDLG